MGFVSSDVNQKEQSVPLYIGKNPTSLRRGVTTESSDDFFFSTPDDVTNFPPVSGTTTMMLPPSVTKIGVFSGWIHYTV